MILATTQIYGSHGGIPSYMRRLSEILTSVTAKQGAPLTAVSLLDESWDPARHIQPVLYRTFCGARGKRSRFIGSLVRAAATHRGQTLVLGHVALAPLGLLLLRCGLIRSYVVVLHGIEAWRRIRLQERIACHSAQLITATTRYTQQLFAAENGVPPDRVAVVPLGLDRLVLHPPETATTPNPKSLCVLFVGRLWSAERYKGVDELIEAVRLLRAEQAAVTLDFVGSGDDLPRLRAKVKSLALEDRITFRGALTSQQLEAAYQECDLFALPSTGEGFGIAFLEAMSYAKPCLGARCGGIPEVIDEGVNGFLVRPGDTGDLVTALKTCLENPVRMREMGRNGFEKVSTRYLFGNMLNHWQTLLAAKDCAS